MSPPGSRQEGGGQRPTARPGTSPGGAQGDPAGAAGLGDVGHTDRRSPGRALAALLPPGSERTRVALPAGLGAPSTAGSVARGCSAPQTPGVALARSRLDGFWRPRPRGPGGQRTGAGDEGPRRGHGRRRRRGRVRNPVNRGPARRGRCFPRLGRGPFSGPAPRPLRAPGEANGGRATWERPGEPRRGAGPEPADPAATAAARTRETRRGPRARLVCGDRTPRRIGTLGTAARPSSRNRAPCVMDPQPAS